MKKPIACFFIRLIDRSVHALIVVTKADVLNTPIYKRHKTFSASKACVLLGILYFDYKNDKGTHFSWCIRVATITIGIIEIYWW